MVLQKLLFLNKRQQLPISAQALRDSIKYRELPVEQVNHILHEMYFHEILSKVYYDDGRESEFDFA